MRQDVVIEGMRESEVRLRDRNAKGQKDDPAGSAAKPVLVRLPQPLLKSLQDEASHRDSSINSLIVSILRRHSRWGQFQERLGFMPLHKSMVIQLMDQMDAPAVEEVGRNQKDQTIKDVILFSNSNYDFGTFVGWIKLRCEVLGFQLMLREEKGCLLIIINHGLGIKWSHYYKGMFEAVLQELLKPGDFDSMKSSLTSSSFSIAISGMAESGAISGS